MKSIRSDLLCFLVLLLISGASCKKDQQGRVPSVPVDATLYLDQPSNLPLTVVGGWIYITGGSRGIVIYRNSPDEFTALDRHCPYEVDNFDRVYVEESNIIASDTVNCGSSFILTDGSITQGPASFPLTRYQTTFNGTSNQLRIFN